MRADELSRHTHVGRTITGYDYGAKKRTLKLHNVIHEDGWVFLCHQRHGAYKFHPSADVEVLP